MNDNSPPVSAVSDADPRVPDTNIPPGGWTLEEAAAELARRDAEADTPPEPESAESDLEPQLLPDAIEPTPEKSEPEPDSLSAPEKDSLLASGSDAAPIPITIDGQEQAVSLDELKAGYQRQADYTRKTQSLAEDRRQLQDERAQYGALLNTLTQRFGAEVAAGPPDETLLEQNPAEYIRQSQRWQAQQQVQGAMARELERVNAETQAHEDQLLSFAMPEWNAPEARAKGKAEVTDYLKQTYQTTDEELDGFVDHRLWQLAHKAMQYDALVSTKDLAHKKVRTAPQMQTPGVAQARQDVDAATVKALRDKFHKSGSIDDAAKLMRYLGG